MYMMPHIIQQQNTELANSTCGNLRGTRRQSDSVYPKPFTRNETKRDARSRGGRARRGRIARCHRRRDCLSRARVLFRALGDALSLMRPEEPVHEHVEPRLEEQEQEGAQKIRHDDSLRASPRRSRRERGAPARPNASDLREVPGASVNARVYPARSRRPSCASPSADVHAELASFLQQHRNRRFRGTASRRHSFREDSRTRVVAPPRGV
jgi:hypothetical protein